MSIKLLIADGQEVARLGLRNFVAGTEIDVVAEATTGTQAVELASSCQPDVVLMSIQMPGEDGLAALKRIRRNRPELPVIMMANRDHSAHFAQAHTLGASGYLLKDVGPDALRATVRAAAAGEQLWTPTHLRRVAGVPATPWRSADIEAPLTPREDEVLQGMSCGHTNQQIAAQLGISYETVKEHVQHILQKIGVNDRTQAAVWAVRKGLV